MPRQRSERSKSSLLRRVRKQRLKYIAILPSLITLLNGVCGFAAIVFAGKAVVDPGLVVIADHKLSYFTMSCFMIGFAMIADVLDGRVARMSQSTSSFGGQLDSLCDIISFGVAPAFLMVKVLEHYIISVGDINPALEVLIYRFIWLAAAIYIGCCAIRLARFNVENEEDEASHMSFSGLPTPGAAGVIGSLVIVHQDFIRALLVNDSLLYRLVNSIILFSLPFIAIGVAFLMISRIRYPHIVNLYLKGRKPFAYFIATIAFIVTAIFLFEISMAVVSCGFALSGVSKWLYTRPAARRALLGDRGDGPILAISNEGDLED